MWLMNDMHAHQTTPGRMNLKRVPGISTTKGEGTLTRTPLCSGLAFLWWTKYEVPPSHWLPSLGSPLETLFHQWKSLSTGSTRMETTGLVYQVAYRGEAKLLRTTLPMTANMRYFKLKMSRQPFLHLGLNVSLCPSPLTFLLTSTALLSLLSPSAKDHKKRKETIA